MTEELEDLHKMNGQPEDISDMIEAKNSEIIIKDLAISAINRNNAILEEIVSSALEALGELYKITSTYHRKILQGTATREDIKECSRIVQRSLKHRDEMVRLGKYYNKVCKEIPAPQKCSDIYVASITKGKK